jgi:hypothetical protein
VLFRSPAPPSPIAPLRAALTAWAELRAATGFAEEANFQALAHRLRPGQFDGGLTRHAHA